MSKKNNKNNILKKNLIDVFEKFSTEIGACLLGNRWNLLLLFLKKVKVSFNSFLMKKK